MFLLVALHWFNPAVWYALRRMRREQEAACDAAVLDQRIPKHIYAACIVRVLELNAAQRQKHRRAPDAGLAFASGRKSVERRIRMIQSHSRQRLAAALLGPLQIALLNATQRADWDRLAGLAHVLGWTPLAAPYTVGLDLADGRAWAVPVKFLITAGTLGALLAWWSRSLESAMVGTADGVGPRTRVSTRGTAGGPLAQLFPRVLAWLPRDQHGALVALHARYWWRDARRRSNLISIAVVGVFVPVMLNVVNRGSSEFAASPAMLSFSLLLIGALAAITLTNQFGFDGSAYAANVVAGVPGRVELRARVLAFSLYTVPLLVAVSIGLVFFLREPSWAGLAVGSLFAGYGAGLAISLFVSILGAYPLPETSNPFALNSGAGVVKSLLTMVALAGAVVAAIPMVVASALLPEVWLWLAAPVGLGYGFGGALLGSWLAGDVLDHQMPELLHRVTPRR